MPSSDRSRGGWQPLHDLIRTHPQGAQVPLDPPAPTAPRWPARSSASRLTAVDRRPCPRCGTEQSTIALPWKGQTVYWWRPCDPCVERWERDYQLVMAGDARARQAQAERELGDPGLSRIQHFTFETFDAAWLLSPTPEVHPVVIVKQWLDSIRDLAHGDLHDLALPPPALFLFSPGKGRGKTHLAGACANAATGWGKLVAFLEETSYLERRWSCPIAEIGALTALPGDRAWLTVIDDLGQRAKATDAVADAWYSVINRRWLRAGWTIFTSNRLPEELLAHGTINEATYSRLMQLIRKQVVFFAGQDQRLT